MKVIGSLLFAVLLVSNANAQSQTSPDVLFSDIGKTLKIGDTEGFSKWFAENLDIEVLGVSNICSKNQAKQILKNFFAKYTPKNFTLIHQSGKDQMQYGIGELLAGGERFRVTLFIYCSDKKSEIQQIRIESELD